MSSEEAAKKSLAQHWLHDKASLRAVCDMADIKATDTVLEIGPGLGTLTQELVKRARKVVAVELDEVLSHRLSTIIQTNNLIVVHEDILKFDLNSMPLKYKVAANIPYYLTGSILRIFTESSNKPQQIALLVQKEVAQRIGAKSGQMSALSVAVQLNYEVKLGRVVPAKLFIPSPKVDSQIIGLDKRQKPLFKDLDTKLYMRLVKAGFSSRRKKLRSSLSAGLAMPKQGADELLKRAGIDGNRRPQELSLQDWHKLYRAAEI